jgi:hypothetical protein
MPTASTAWGRVLIGAAEVVRIEDLVVVLRCGRASGSALEEDNVFVVRVHSLGLGSVAGRGSLRGFGRSRGSGLVL